MNPINGGPCQGIRNAIPALNELGTESEVVCLDNPEADFIKKDAFKIYALGLPKTSWGYNSRLYDWLIINLCNYDYVVVHGLWQFHSFAVTKAIKKLKEENSKNLPKVCIMPHGMLDPYFQKAVDRKLKAIRNSIYWHFIESKVIKQADAVLFTSNEELLLARTTFNKYAPQLEINVGYGIPDAPIINEDEKKSFLKQIDIKESKSFILFLSRLHIKKGVDLLINAYIDLYQEDDKNVDFPELVIAGPGTESSYIQSLIKSVNEKTMENRIHFVGMLSGSKKWAAFLLAEAFILPSHQENFGIAVAESLSCSTPVLISDKINIWREIQQENAGFVASDTYTGCKEILSRWIQTPKDIKDKMRQNAKNAHNRHFTIHAAAQSFNQGIKKLN